MNDEWDELLKNALGRTQPPAGFAERVMARTERKRTGTFAWKAFGAVAATIALAASGYLGYREHQAAEAEQRLQASRQLVFALQLTSEKITAVDQRLKNSSAQLRVREENFERKN